MGGMVSCQKPLNTYQEDDEKGPSAFQPVQPIAQNPPSPPTLPIVAAPVVEEVIVLAEQAPEEKKPSEISLALTMTLKQRFSVLNKYSSDEESDSWAEPAPAVQTASIQPVAREESAATPEGPEGLGLATVPQIAQEQKIKAKSLASRSIARPPPPPGAKRQNVLANPPQPTQKQESPKPIGSQTAPVPAMPKVVAPQTSALKLPPPPPPPPASPMQSPGSLPKPPKLQSANVGSPIPPPPPAASMGIKPLPLPAPAIPSPSSEQRQSVTPAQKKTESKPEEESEHDSEAAMEPAETLGTCARAFLESVISDAGADEPDLF